MCFLPVSKGRLLIIRLSVRVRRGAHPFSLKTCLTSSRLMKVERPWKVKKPVNTGFRPKGLALMKLSTPKYRLHRPSGLAVVTIAGKDLYLGRA